eukprot:CAMPEP_0117446346 /NCGR_PEP_ID=MMETSP0759-20121206/6292_1 /TAXON_ID=63605 /ORGANISM="Percolomonas cosmopolitus, Strain WS" /LENGTH=519 /DNA_ID=CAMNT_0005238607 /DNA_START=50 /DNA_END=1605 /DNA_ORIENTATION=+
MPEHQVSSTPSSPTLSIHEVLSELSEFDIANSNDENCPYPSESSLIEDLFQEEVSWGKLALVDLLLREIQEDGFFAGNHADGGVNGSTRGKIHPQAPGTSRKDKEGLLGVNNMDTSAGNRKDEASQRKNRVKQIPRGPSGATAAAEKQRSLKKRVSNAAATAGTNAWSLQERSNQDADSIRSSMTVDTSTSSQSRKRVSDTASIKSNDRRKRILRQRRHEKIQQQQASPFNNSTKSGRSSIRSSRSNSINRSRRSPSNSSIASASPKSSRNRSPRIVSSNSSSPRNTGKEKPMIPPLSLRNTSKESTMRNGKKKTVGNSGRPSTTADTALNSARSMQGLVNSTRSKRITRTPQSARPHTSLGNPSNGGASSGGAIPHYMQHTTSSSNQSSTANSPQSPRGPSANNGRRKPERVPQSARPHMGQRSSLFSSRVSSFVASSTDLQSPRSARSTLTSNTRGTPRNRFDTTEAYMAYHEQLTERRRQKKHEVNISEIFKQKLPKQKITSQGTRDTSYRSNDFS